MSITKPTLGERRLNENRKTITLWKTPEIHPLWKTPKLLPGRDQWFWSRPGWRRAPKSHNGAIAERKR
ncbi:hypothetical protein HHJ78_00770 [Mobiluncus mulieris]|uniref:Uncharacterized protein n=1 Tax=Mobiluncus mulieris TaxID=2052 RepID=A0A7Y0TZC8_9ACTO|nr:hypothetical protein [Mobiluncus mulieris]